MPCGAPWEGPEHVWMGPGQEPLLWFLQEGRGKAGQQAQDWLA